MHEEKRLLTKEGFSSDEAEAVLTRAAELQRQVDEQRGVLQREDLKEGAEAAGIAREYIDKAIEQIRTERQRESMRLRERSRKLWIAGIAAAAVLILLLLFGYQRLNSRYSEVEDRWAQVENVMQRRHDLIPNLIAMTKASATHEQSLAASLSSLVEEARNSHDVTQRLQIESRLDESASRLLSSLRADPSAASNSMFIRLSDEMAGAENRIATERKRYNQAVTAYNRSARSLPVSLVRPLLGFPSSAPYYQTSAAAQSLPQYE